jgi:hypothetical protein
VFARFVEDPPSTSATLTFKAIHHGSSQQQQQQSPSSQDAAVLQLSQQQLQQLMQQLLLLLSDNRAENRGSSSSRMAAAAGDKPSIMLRACSSSSSTTNSRGLARSFLSPAAAAAVTDRLQPQLELLMNDAVAAQLLPGHVRSLMTVLEDMSGQLYSQYGVVQPPVQVRTAAGLIWLSGCHACLPAAASPWLDLFVILILLMAFL